MWLVQRIKIASARGGGLGCQLPWGERGGRTLLKDKRCSAPGEGRELGPGGFYLHKETEETSVPCVHDLF